MCIAIERQFEGSRGNSGVVEIGGIGSSRSCRFPKNVGGCNCVECEVSEGGYETRDSRDLAWDTDEV
jgi:hypothetical protein